MSPRDYEAIKKKLLKEGKGEKAAKTSAAKITNARRKKAGKPPAKFHRGR